MAPITAAALKGCLVLAIFVALLRSSTGQQSAAAPAPAPLDCSNCATNCTQRCQAMADAQARYCNGTFGSGGVYDACLDGLASHTCSGNSYAARGSCTYGTCTPQLCGNPCVQDVCKSCTDIAGSVYNACMSAVSRIWQFCMPSCTSNCQLYGYCVSG